MKKDTEILKKELDKFVTKMVTEFELFSADPEVCYLEIKEIVKDMEFGLVCGYCGMRKCICEYDNNSMLKGE